MVNNAAGNFISPTERLSANAFQTILDIVLKVGKERFLYFEEKNHEGKQLSPFCRNILTVDKFLTGNGVLNPGDREEDDQSSEWRSLPRHHNPLHQRGREIILDKFLLFNYTIDLVLSFLTNRVDTFTCTGLWLCCSQRLCQVWGGDHDEVSWGRVGQVHCQGQPPSKCFLF